MNTDIDRPAATVKAELKRMLDAGCSFADARFYDEDRGERLTLYDGNLETNYGANERGIGIRTLFKGAWGFAATADLTSIPACFEKALANAKAATMLPGFPRDMGPAQPAKGEYRPPVKQDPFEVPMAEKLALLSGIDAKLKDNAVAHRYVTAGFQRRKIFYWNSEGTEVDRWALNTFGSMAVMAPDPQGRTQRRTMELFCNGDGTRGYEWLANPDAFGGHAERVRKELSEIIAAEPPGLPPGPRDHRPRARTRPDSRVRAVVRGRLPRPPRAHRQSPLRLGQTQRPGRYRAQFARHVRVRRRGNAPA